MNSPFSKYPPSEILAPYLFNFWEAVFNPDASEAVQFKTLPNGTVELIIHLSDEHCGLIQQDSWVDSPEYTLIGLRTQPYPVRFRRRVEVFGIRFKPEGIPALFGIPAAEFLDRQTNMEEVLGGPFRTFCARLREAAGSRQRIEVAEAYLKEQLLRKAYYPDYFAKAVELIRKRAGQLSVEDLSSKVFISRRQLERAFREKLGLTPVQYIRLSRVLKAYEGLRNDPGANLGALSYSCGFADQAHFNRELKSWTGEAPTALRSMMERVIF